MLGSKPSETPMDSNLRFDLDSGDTLMDKGRYKRLVGRINYLSHTRSNIAFVVSVMSHHMYNPQEKHLKAINQILQFLKKTLGRGLFFGKNTDRKIEAFTDADRGEIRGNGAWDMLVDVVEFMAEVNNKGEKPRNSVVTTR